MIKKQLFFLLCYFCCSIFAIEYEEARHLLSRTGFSGTPSEIDAILSLTYEETVDNILRGIDAPVLAPPAWTQQEMKKHKKKNVLLKVMSEEQKQQYRMLSRQEMKLREMQLKSWWYQQMMESSSPFQERMVMFWHNHFTSSLQKVKFPYLIYEQHLLFRKYATGNFLEFTQEVAKNPAMILYLDNQTNHKNKPNENFARELLELFTLGEGNYSEVDIKQAARAFTGWMVDRNNGSYFFNKNRHDFGEKEFMKHKGNFDGNDIIDIVFKKPRVSIYIVSKLWKEFISDVPDEKEVERLAKIFRSNYELKPLLRELFLSSHFRDRKNFGCQIKSPVEFIVGTVRMFKIQVANHIQLVQYGKQLGQDVFDPPNVKGWPGGHEWITSNSLLARRQMVQRAIRGADMFLERFWVWHYMDEKKSGLDTWLGLKKKDKIQKIRKILLPVESVNVIPENMDILTAVQTMITDLSYQLK